MGAHLELDVTDTGRGLPPDLLTAQSRTLGLRIVQILAKRLEATVQVDTSQGSRFTLTFPREAAVPVEPRPE